MRQTVPRSKMVKARAMVIRGLSVKQIAKELLVSESWVRSYTKSERAYMKEPVRKMAR